LTSSLQSFFFCVLKWQKLHDWAKDKNKKSIVEALNRYEKHSLAGKKKINPVFFLENGTEKILQQSAVERDKTKHKIGLGKPKTIA